MHKGLAVLAVGATVVAIGAPEGLEPRAWHLFAIFLSTIVAVLVGAAPLLPVALLALGVTVLSGTLTPAEAYSAFAADFLLLIVAAFLVSRAFLTSGLGERVAYAIIRRIGHSTLGLAYGLILTDVLIAPAIPSNTARSGVLFPIYQSLALGTGSDPDESRHRTGSFLMMAGMTGLTISSGLWLTAMAANPAGAQMAREQGVDVTFGTWLLAACVPSLAALVVVPYLLYRVFPPERTRTPEAPRDAAEKLRERGPMTTPERTTAVVFGAMVVAWALSSRFGWNMAAIAFTGLGVLMLAGVLDSRDMRREGNTLAMFLWFGILYALSTQLNALGFMSYVGAGMAARLDGLPWPVVYVALVVGYVLIHYLFVSQTAHMLAVYGIFLSVGINAGVPAAMLAFMLLLATNFFAVITPQASSANLLFVGSGYITPGEVYRYGGFVTLANTLVYLAVGTAWLAWVT